MTYDRGFSGIGAIPQGLRRNIDSVASLAVGKQRGEFSLHRANRSLRAAQRRLPFLLEEFAAMLNTPAAPTIANTEIGQDTPPGG